MPFNLSRFKQNKKDSKTRKRFNNGSTSLPRPVPSLYRLPLFDFQPAQPLRSSQLLRIPFELRFMVYDYLFRGNVIYLFTAFKKLAYICCNSSSSHDLTKAWCRSAAHFDHTRRVNVEASILPIPLLLSCRKLYTELIPILYGENVFNIEDMKAFIRFCEIIPSQGLTAIKHLNVHWTAPQPPLQYPGTGLRFLRKLPYANVTYVQFWHTVAKEMPGLRKLQFVIDDCRWLGKVSIDDAWLGPLKEVRGLGRFDLGTEGGWARMQVTGIEHELRIIMCASRET